MPVTVIVQVLEERENLKQEREVRMKKKEYLMKELERLRKQQGELLCSSGFRFQVILAPPT